MDIEFKNGSFIKSFEKTVDITRGNRAKLITFLCTMCNTLFIDVDKCKIDYTSEHGIICRDCISDIIR